MMSLNLFHTIFLVMFTVWAALTLLVGTLLYTIRIGKWSHPAGLFKTVQLQFNAIDDVHQLRSRALHGVDGRTIRVKWPLLSVTTLSSSKTKPPIDGHGH